MNWLKAFWKKLTAPPPSAARRVITSSAPATPRAGHSPTSLPANTPPSSIPKVGRNEPRESNDAMHNFTPRAQQTLALARKEADRLRHNFVGTEHVLLGLLHLGQGTAVTALTNMGLNLENVRAEIEKQVGTGPDQKMIGNIPYTPRVKKVLALAAKEAKALDHTYVGTEHILLGLLREGDGVAARVLKNLNVDIEKTRAQILEEPNPNETGAALDIPTESAAYTPRDRSELPRDRFTPRVRRTFTLALEEAERRNQPLVETEHVLLGLIRMGQGVAASVLIKIGVNAETVAARLEPSGPAKPTTSLAEPPHFSPLVKEVLAFAAEEAKELDHTYIGTEHILLGLLRRPNSDAGRILKALYVDLEILRKQVLLAFEVKTVHPSAGSSGGIAMQPSEKDTEMYAKKTSTNPAPAANPAQPAKPPREPVNSDERYDVYCVERNHKIVVYRNVRFKSVKGLFPRNDYDQWSDFVELEQSDGQTFFISKSMITRFCPPGAKPEIENI
jgi:hypothetical protein